MYKNVYTLLTHKKFKAGSFKVCLYIIVLSVTVCTVRYVCLLRIVQFFVDFVSFLPMIIYEVLIHYCDA